MCPGRIYRVFLGTYTLQKTVQQQPHDKIFQNQNRIMAVNTYIILICQCFSGVFPTNNQKATANWN